MHSDLLLYPILALALATVVLLLEVFAVLLLFNFDIGVFFRLTWVQSTALTYAFYVVAYGIGIYTNTALVATVLQLMQGKPPDVAASWRLANSRLVSIVGYAFLMATVGMVLRVILRPIGFAGKILGPVLAKTVVFTLVGLAWNLVPYFVVPVLIVENAGTMPAIRRSSQLVKKGWGEDVVVNASVWLIFLLPLLIVLLLGAPAIAWAISTMDERVVVLAVYIVVMLVLLTLMLKFAMDGIFSAATYRYAVAQEVQAPFGERDLQLAFRTRHSRLVGRVRRWFPGLFPPTAAPAGVPEEETSVASAQFDGL
jgi:hypothetical protein